MDKSAATVQVCMACGKIKGEHRGWDVSCELHSHEFDVDQIVRGEDGRVKEIREP